jgi:hypothetical protein
MAVEPIVDSRMRGTAILAAFGRTMAHTEVTKRRKVSALCGARPAGQLDRPRPWKSTDAAAAAKEFLMRPRKAAIRELLEGLCSDDPYEHRCAAEVARLVSIREPGILEGCSDILAEAAAAFPDEEWQARGYVIVAAAHNALTRAQRRRLLPTVRERLRPEERIGVRAMALEAFLVLGAQDAELRDEAVEMMEEARRSPIPALRARARRMLPMLLKAQTSRAGLAESRRGRASIPTQ